MNESELKTVVGSICLLLCLLTGCASTATVARMDGFNSQWRGWAAIQGAPAASREATITVKVIVSDDMGGYPQAAGTYSHPQGIIHIRGKIASDGKVILCESVIGHEIMHALQFQVGGFVNPDKLSDLGY